MDNCKSNWRVWAKVVALINLNLTVICVLALFVPLMVTPLQDAQDEVRHTAGYLLLFRTIDIAVILAGLRAAMELIRATELGRTAKDAYSGCVFWQIINTVFLLLSIIYGLCQKSNLLLIVADASFIFIAQVVVYMFMRELKSESLL